MRPIAPPPVKNSGPVNVTSVNHKAPSGPIVMLPGSALAPGTEYSLMVPCGVIMPMKPLALAQKSTPQSDSLLSVNQTLPSGPALIPFGCAAVGNSLKAPDTVIRPMRLGNGSVNHSAPSGPAAMLAGSVPGAGNGNSVITPAVVILSIAPLPASANQRFPSGPLQIPAL